ncbi:MAG: TIGR01777 family oxidoreductase [Acidobacteriota bacterium]|nr:TIGR01777 family oxidoreductase [Acidobacteriota bacterium]
MKIVVSGGTGFLGEPLVRRLLQRGAEVLVLSRDPSKVRIGQGIPWSAVSEAGTAEVIINLAGENVGAGRWTAERKRNILNSRVEATTALVTAIRRAREKPRTFISASAVGFYGVREDEILDERSESGSGFLAEVTLEWEEVARRAEGVARVVIFRFGVVLARDGGPLKKMLLPFYFGAGGPIGSGNQWMSWVDREDLLRAIEWAIDNPQVRGTYNITAPEPVRNRDFARALGRLVHRPSFMPTPAFALRLAFGEMADEILLGGQRVVPSRATKEGFTFNYPTLEASLQRV